MSYLGVSIWEGELKDSEPSLPGNIENVSNYSVDIFSDVLSSPDFGLAVLGFVAPRIASYKIWNPVEGSVPFPLAFLPWFLFLSQWGLLLAVFIQSIKEWQSNKFDFCYKSGAQSFEKSDTMDTFKITRTVMFFICVL